jgi:hypothetical protein
MPPKTPMASNSWPWSFYIFSSGGSLNQSWIGSFEPEGCDELALLRHFLA